VLPDCGELTTLRQVGEYVAALPRREHDKPHWQTAMQYLIDAAERGGIVMLADIAMRRALYYAATTAAAKAPPRKEALRVIGSSAENNSRKQESVGTSFLYIQKS